MNLIMMSLISAVLNSRENRVLCALAASTGWSVHQTDITQAFTHGEP
jgi:hypothetical protein